MGLKTKLGNVTEDATAHIFLKGFIQGFCAATAGNIQSSKGVTSATRDAWQKNMLGINEEDLHKSGVMGETLNTIILHWHTLNL